MLHQTPEFTPQPHPIIEEVYTGPELAHVAVNDRWTVSYTLGGQCPQPTVQYASHHSESGDAAFSIADVHQLPSAERTAILLGAIGLSLNDTVLITGRSLHAVRSLRSEAYARYFNNKETQPGLHPTIASMVHLLFRRGEYFVCARLDETPSQLRNPNAVDVLNQAVYGRNSAHIGRKLGISADTVKSRLGRIYAGNPPINNLGEAITLMHLRPRVAK